MVATYHNVYDRLAEFIAGMNPERVLAFFAPTEIQNRVDELVGKQKDGLLKPEEAEELEHYFIFEHIVRLAKIRAFAHISQAEA